MSIENSSEVGAEKPPEIKDEEKADKELSEAVSKKYERFGGKVEEVEKPPGWLPEMFSHYPKPEKKSSVIEDIRYTTPEGKIFPLKDLLPERWKFKRVSGDCGMSADPSNKEVVYPKSEETHEPNFQPAILTRGFFLGLFHEIGHAHSFEGKKDEEKKEMLRTYADASRGVIETDARVAEYIIKEERNAWAWALKTFRELRRKDIDLEPTLPSTKEIFHEVDRHILSYEKNMTPEAFDKIHRIHRMFKEEK